MTVAPTPNDLCTPRPAEIILPDLVAHCTFALRVNPHAAAVARASERWICKRGNLNLKKRNSIRGLQAGLLTAMCWPDAGQEELKVCADFLTYLFHLDDLTDDMDVRSASATADIVLTALYHPHRFAKAARVDKMTRSLWSRIIAKAAPGTRQRFIETMDFFFQTVAQQAEDRRNGHVPDLEAYIAMRRDTSACKPCWVLIEYAHGLDLPDEVMEHPVVLALGEAANDLVTWSNDLFSYNVEQARGDTHNMIPVVMHEQGLELQDAVDFVGSMCKASIDRFVENLAALPSWTPAIDRGVALYADGLANWIVGSLHWSFVSERYFGTDGAAVKASRVVHLAPMRPC